MYMESYYLGAAPTSFHLLQILIISSFIKPEIAHSLSEYISPTSDLYLNWDSFYI